MKVPLRILHLEDDLNDAAIILSILESGGITCLTNRVEDEESFTSALEAGDIDLILSDFSLPTFDGLSALKIARVKQPELPVIFVSGTLGEERAIDSLTAGATDYVLKENLGRLIPAIRRTMLEIEIRQERRQSDAKSVEGQKMEIIGQLAGGVAHDFNNILAVIIGYCELLRHDLAPGSPQLRYAEEIGHASERASGLTRQLLVSCRKQTVQAVSLNLNDVVVEMDKMLRRLIDANIEMTLAPGKQIGNVYADSGYVGQVLMNLVVNARDALPFGGKIVIATSDVTIDQGSEETLAGAIPGDFVMLSVSDNGTGMTDEVKARLFEPLFTTKPLGKGTGLGLATCQNIIQLSGGYIKVRTASGMGTTFEVYFPRHKEIPGSPSSTAACDVMPRGTETLLVVEDDPMVRLLACTLLESQGYQVLQANNGQEGIRVVSECNGPPIRLVLTDVIMPVMGGKAMAEVLKFMNPDIQVLFTSGYSDDEISLHGVLDTEVNFVAKPYTPSILARKVRDMLDSASSH